MGRKQLLGCPPFAPKFGCIRRIAQLQFGLCKFLCRVLISCLATATTWKKFEDVDEVEKHHPTNGAPLGSALLVLHPSFRLFVCTVNSTWSVFDALRLTDHCYQSIKSMGRPDPLNLLTIRAPLHTFSAACSLKPFDKSFSCG